MINPLKKEEKKPYAYSSIEMRKSSNRTVWIIMGLLVLAIGFIFLFSKNSQKSASLLATPSPTTVNISGLKEYKNDTYNWSVKYDDSKYYPYEPVKGNPTTIWFNKKEPNDDFYCISNFEVEVLIDNQTKKVIDNPEKLTVSDWLKQKENKETLFPQFSKRELTKINDYEAMKFINDSYKETITKIQDPFKPIVYVVAAEDKIFFLSYNISTDKETKEICNGNEEVMDKIFQTFTYTK